MRDKLNVRVEVPDLSDIHDAVELAGDLRVFPRFNAYVSDPALPFDVDIVAEFEAGKFRVKKLTATKRPDGDEVTTEGLRKVPVTAIMQQAVEGIVVEGKWGPATVDWGPAVIPVRNTYVGPDDEALLLVASFYRLADMVGLPPRKYVSERLGVPMSTVSRWIALARTKKLLDKPT